MKALVLLALALSIAFALWKLVKSAHIADERLREICSKQFGSDGGN